MDKIKKVLSDSSKEDEATTGPYGTSTNVPAPTDSKPADAARLKTEPDADNNSHGIFRQILNPHGDKYSEQSFGRTASTSEESGPPGSLQTKPEAEKDSHGVLRQALNPNGEKYSEQSHGTTATQVPLTGTVPSSSTTAAPWRWSWRRGALASGANQRGNRADDVTDSTYTAPSYPLSSGPDRTADSAEMSNSQHPVAGVVPVDASHQSIQDPSKLDTAGRLGPHVPGEFPTEDGEDPHAPGAFPITPYEEADRGIGSGAVVATGVEQPSAADSALSPPADSQSRTTPTTAIPPAAPVSMPVEPEPEAEHRYGRDAAMIGGGTAVAGAAGYGMFQATKDDGVPTVPAEDPYIKQNIASEATTTYEPTTTHQPATTYETVAAREPPATYEETATSGPMSYTKPTQSTTEDTNYTRDAAIVGGTGVATGAAGYGIYEATNDGPSDTGPASKTIGPHESNIANIMDPRVKPEPEKMKESEPITEGHHKSDLANIADPRVKQTESTRLQKSAPEDTRYGSEAAVAGGTGTAGVAGYGAYEANQESEPSTPTRASRTSHESPSSNNKTSVDSKGHHHLHKKRVEQQGEKKPGLVSRMLHPNRTKQEKEEQEVARRSYERQSQEYDGANEGSTSYTAADGTQTDPPTGYAAAPPMAEERYR